MSCAHIMEGAYGLDIKQEIDDSEDVIERINKHGLEYEFLGTVKNEDTDEIAMKENQRIKVGRDGSECHKQMTVELDGVQYQISEMKREKKLSEESSPDFETDKESKEQNIVWIAENCINSEPVEATPKDDTPASGKVHLYKCKFCEYETKKKRLLVRHFRRVHDENINLVSCDLCEFKTKYRNSLQRHRNIMHNENKCNICDRKYRDKRGLNAHIKNEHIEDEWYQPIVCDRKCKYKCHLKAHMHGENVEWHMNSSPNENPEWYKCQLCEFETVVETRLSEHERSNHNDTKWHHCSRCEFSTKIAHNMEQHMKYCHSEYDHLEGVNMDVEENSLNNSTLEIVRTEEEALDNKCSDIIKSEDVREETSESANPVSSSKCFEDTNTKDIKGVITKSVNPVSSNICLEIMKTEDVKEVTFTKNTTGEANCDNIECREGMTLKLRNAWKNILKKIKYEGR